MSRRTAVVSLDQAFELALAWVATENDRSDARHELALIDDRFGELWWAWIISCHSADFCRTRDPRHVLLGLGPLLVDKFTGEVIQTGTGSRLHKIERERGYRAWWKFWGPNSIMTLPEAEHTRPDASSHRTPRV